MSMRDIQKMQQRLLKMQEELEASNFVGTAGGGAVTITMSRLSLRRFAIWRTTSASPSDSSSGTN